MNLPVKCTYCSEMIVQGEKSQETNDGALLFHYECFIRMLAGSVGHLNKKCSCFGGTQEDPPDMTKRQAAKAASDLYHQIFEGDFYESYLDSLGIHRQVFNFN